MNKQELACEQALQLWQAMQATRVHEWAVFLPPRGAEEKERLLSFPAPRTCKCFRVQLSYVLSGPPNGKFAHWLIKLV